MFVKEVVLITKHLVEIPVRTGVEAISETHLKLQNWEKKQLLLKRS